MTHTLTLGLLAATLLLSSCNTYVGAGAHAGSGYHRSNPPRSYSGRSSGRSSSLLNANVGANVKL